MIYLFRASFWVSKDISENRCFQSFDSHITFYSLQEIRNEANNYEYTYQDAKKVENKSLNRYRDVNPYDHSRVRLRGAQKDYINASLVKVPAANRAYILTQGPLPNTLSHFWLMVWEQKSKAIVMLNKTIEKDVVKCHQYWPSGEANKGYNDLVINDIGLKVTYLGEAPASNYTVRELLITDVVSGYSRVVLHFHYTSWPDFGVPESPAAFLNFLIAVRDSGALDSDVGPPVIHCSAGIGRSGTFCLADSCLILIEKKQDINAVNVREVLLEMRRYRMGLIQTPDQLRFSYLAIIEGAKRVLSKKKTDTVPLESIRHDEVINDSKSQGELCNNVSPDSKTQMYNAKNELMSNAANEDSEDSPSVTPPPLPPRSKGRSVDLTASTSNESSMSSNEEADSEAPYPRAQKPRIIPCENKEAINTDQPKAQDVLSSPDSNEEREIRKRKRHERLEKTAETIQKIRQRQHEAESRHYRRSKTNKSDIPAKSPNKRLRR